MLHELVFLECHSQFASYPYTFASYSYGCKILRPFVAATVRMHSDAVLSSTCALLMKTVTGNNPRSQIVHIRFGRIRLLDTCESALKTKILRIIRPDNEKWWFLYLSNFQKWPKFRLFREKWS